MLWLISYIVALIIVSVFFYRIGKEKGWSKAMHHRDAWAVRQGLGKFYISGDGFDFPVTTYFRYYSIDEIKKGQT